MTPIARLRRQLCRELAQSEHDAEVHCAREQRRLAGTWPASALEALSAHAATLRPSLDRVLGAQPVGRRLGRMVGAVFSAARHFFIDRLISRERSFRATLLGLKHGVDVVRLLREVALREGDRVLLRWCDHFLVERSALIEHAEQSLAWFAERPEHALASGLRIAPEGAIRLADTRG